MQARVDNQRQIRTINIIFHFFFTLPETRRWREGQRGRRGRSSWEFTCSFRVLVYDEERYRHTRTHTPCSPLLLTHLVSYRTTAYHITRRDAKFNRVFNFHSSFVPSHFLNWKGSAGLQAEISWHWIEWMNNNHYRFWRIIKNISFLKYPCRCGNSRKREILLSYLVQCFVYRKVPRYMRNNITSGE